MSGGRFLVGLGEIETSEQILATKSSQRVHLGIEWRFKKQFNEIAGDLENCSLESNAKKKATVVSGYVVKKW